MEGEVLISGERQLDCLYAKVLRDGILLMQRYQNISKNPGGGWCEVTLCFVPREKWEEVSKLMRGE